MTDAQKVIARYSIACRTLTGPCAGVELHQLRRHPHHFGAVVDGDKVWFVGPLSREKWDAFILNTAAGFYFTLGKMAA